MEPIPIYNEVVREAARRGIRFGIGGSLAMASYGRLNRPTKDLDLYVMPEDRDCLIAVLTDLGLNDYYPQVAYDRCWIYRAVKEDAIVDVIWQMANRRSQVDEGWLTHGARIRFGDQCIPLIALEELIWSKLYVLQRDRSDWPDILNLLHSSTEKIDWQRLLGRIGADAPLLYAVLRIYAWLDPVAATSLPGWLQHCAGLVLQSDTVDTPYRAALLDSRPWLFPDDDKEENSC
jgi:hypothetical protein